MIKKEGLDRKEELQLLKMVLDPNSITKKNLLAEIAEEYDSSDFMDDNLAKTYVKWRELYTKHHLYVTAEELADFAPECSDSINEVMDSSIGPLYNYKEVFDNRRKLIENIGKLDKLNGATYTFMNMQKANTVEKLEDEEMLWTGMIPSSGITFLTARGGVGKGFFALSIASVLTNDKPVWMDGTERKEQGAQTVLYIDLEDTYSEIRRRTQMYEISIPEDKFFVMSSDNKSGFKLNDENFIRDLRQSIDEHQFRLIIIDSYNEASPGIDENNAKDNQWMLKPLRDLSIEKNVCVMILHHNSKDGKGYRGSTGIEAQARAVIELQPQDDQSIRIKRSKLNRKKATNSLTYVITDDGPEYTVYEDSPAFEVNKKISKYSQIRAFFMKYLIEHQTCTSKKADELSDEHGWNRNSVRNATQSIINKEYGIWSLKNHDNLPEGVLIESDYSLGSQKEPDLSEWE